MSPDCHPAFGDCAVAHAPVGRVMPGAAIVTWLPLIATTRTRCVCAALWLSEVPFQAMSPLPVKLLSLTK